MLTREEKGGAASEPTPASGIHRRSRGAMPGLRLVRVPAGSRAAALVDADYVVVRSYGALRQPRSGDLVCVGRVDADLLIERLGDQAEDGRFRLAGGATAPDSPWVSTNDLLGRVITRLHPAAAPG